VPRQFAVADGISAVTLVVRCGLGAQQHAGERW